MDETRPQKVDTIECPKCGNKEDFYRTFIAYERIWPDGIGGYGYKDEETLEVTEIKCRVCDHKGKPEEFNY